MDYLTFLRTHWDRHAGWLAIVAGAAVILAGWLGVSGTPYVFEQLPYIISGGIGGLFLLGVGATLLLSADLRDEWNKLDAIEDHLAHGVRPDAVATDGSRPDATAAQEPDLPKARRRRILAEAHASSARSTP